MQAGIAPSAYLHHRLAGMTLWISRHSSRKPRSHHPHREEKKHYTFKQHSKPQQQPIQRHRSQEYYEEKLKRDLAERMEAKRQKFSFRVKKKKDDYIMELPQKKQRSESWTRKPVTQEQNEVFSNQDDFSDPWKTTESEPKKEEKPKKGMFNLFD